MKDRITHLRSIMKESSVDAFLLSSTSNIFYVSGFNRFLVDHDGYLFVTPTKSYLITSPLYTEAVKKYTPELNLLETSGDAWYAQLIKKIMEKENLQVLGFEEIDLRVSEYFDLEDEKMQLKSVSLRYLRTQKNTEEIAATRKACEITDKTFEKILPFIQEGVTELALSNTMSSIAQSLGAEIGFPTIVAFGPHSATPHHMTSDEKLTKNSFILFDFGLRYNQYLSDTSRTVFFGTPTDEQKKLYEAVKVSQQAAIDYIKKHSSEDLFVKDIDLLSRNIIEKEGFPSFPHALGHGIGLEVHEAPTLSKYSPEKLIEGTIFTIEPGSYLSGLGGVRIEDTCVIENSKLEVLNHATKELIVIS